MIATNSAHTDTHSERLSLLTFPECFSIETVSKCNLRCSMCPHKTMKRKQGYMSWEIFTKAIDEIALKNKKARVWLSFFGEPFIASRHKPSLFDMIKYAKEKGCEHLLFNTNACLMTENNMKRVIEAGIDEMHIGLDAFSAKVYSENRIGGNYEKTKENVIRCLKYIKENNLSKPKIFMQFIEMDNNMHELNDFTSFWLKQGATVKTRPMGTWHGHNERKAITQKNDSERHFCASPLRSMVIINDGRIATCGNDFDIENSFGNIMGSSIEQIWNTKMLEFRQKHLENRFDELPKICHHCQDWKTAKRNNKYIKLNL